MRVLFLFMLCISTFWGCKEEISMEDKVIAIHDEVMPKMGALKKASKSLTNLDTSALDMPSKKMIKETIIYLHKADDGMMDWMEDWAVPEDPEAKKSYLEKEMVRITQVKNDILISLDKANSILKQQKK